MTPLTPRVKRLLAFDEERATGAAIESAGRAGLTFNTDQNNSYRAGYQMGMDFERARTSQLEEALLACVDALLSECPCVNNYGDGVCRCEIGPVIKRLADACSEVEKKNV